MITNSADCFAEASIKIRGKVFSESDIAALQLLISAHPDKGRVQLSRIVCEQYGWTQANGELQDVACRGILLKLERRGMVRLPARKGPGRDNTSLPVAVAMELALEEIPVEGRLGQFAACRLEKVGPKREESQRWNGLIQRYHYLGYRPMVGRSLRYWIKLGDQEVGVIGWGSPSWKLASRDELIGWEPRTREKNLQGIANNTRFLIFPWVHVKYLASHVLSLCARQVPVDWKDRYGVELSLFETFVDVSRYRGTCYKAANWIHVGESRGSSKSGDSYNYHGQKKAIYVYPLVKDFRKKLCQ